MKKIVYIRPGDIYVTPAFSRIVEASQLLDDPSVKIYVIQWLNDEQSKSEDGITYLNFTKKRGALGMLGWFWFILSKLLSIAPRYVHNFSFHSWTPILIYKIFYPKRIDLFYDCRDYFGWSFSLSPLTKRFSIWADRRIARICKQIIFPDRNGFVYFNTQADKYTAIPNTVTDFLAGQEINRPDTGKNIRLFYAGYLSNDRNIKAIIEAVKTYQHLELHIAANFISNQFDQSLLEDPRFVYHGKLSHQRVIELMLECDYCLIMYNAALENYRLIQPTKFYDSLMSNTPYICAEGMTALKENCGPEWPNLCLAYNSVEAFADLKKPVLNNKNRSLYTSTYEYTKVLGDIAKVYDKYLTP
ncbi:hypothetical protein [Gilvibacter sediminis]|uniref:hypothetical protein n=1 Tax=Gilvibacter sediminis TaxID=379071 RepID=UPI002350AE78|nr:hypothetical protein [Gilvibacter sediminis]MDC7999123.1 hypothetical protein [Gilvibacter sediminis]